MQLKVNSKISTLALCVSVLLGNSGQALADNDSSELSTGSAPVAKSIQLSDPLHAGDSLTLSVDDIAQDPDGDTLYIDQVEVVDDAGSVESQSDDSVTLEFFNSGRQKVTFTISDSTGEVLVTTATFNIDVLSDKQLHRFFNQATFGPTHELMEGAASFDIDAWLDEQFAMPVSSHEALAQEIGGNDYAANDDAWLELANYGDDQLRQRVAFALSEVFVVSRYGTLYEYPQSQLNYYDVLNYGAFGNFRDLISKVTRHPAMGTYLTLRNSKKENEEQGTYPDENYAREVMQLFTIGLYELNNDGSAKTDSDGNKIETYTQDDIRNVAKALTGWVRASGDELLVKPMVAKESYHDDSEKVVMGTTIPAGQSTEEDLSSVLDILFNHPNTAPFFAKHMIKRLITSNPSPEYIERVANVFIDNGEGVRGDMQAVIRAILTDEEALGEDSEHMPIKAKEPIVAVVNLMRALDMETETEHVVNSDIPFWRIGQGPMRANSVFNFYSQDYSPSGTDISAPELEFMTWPTYIVTHNYMRTFVADWRTPLLPDYSYLQEAGEDTDELMRRIGLVFYGGELDERLEEILRAHVEFLNTRPTYEETLKQLMEFVISSEDFYIQD
ncbi:Protein of unknown function [Vibrio xiamenensis]|uniref:DUF1800 domain-containing protein n=1 Tax=Vibrio xiamenensis TaxID=861298 RepID=A0A1G8A9Q3_9VIBR|nr:DUF1800 family protein [Vibrio xiamenensis]SDH17745.1 Protein of unknown function [Vibrio xiamenensis]